jgi:ABC-2 type transport system ATP-binding protein
VRTFWGWMSLKARVGGERLEVRLENRERSDAAVAALAEIGDGAPGLVDGAISVPISQRRGAIATAVRRLDDAHIAVDDIVVRSPTLDDVFLTLTGRAAEPEEESQLEAKTR